MIESIGRDKEGRKLFGFNKSISRAELTEFLKQVAEYKQNPSIYKKKKAAVRSAADKAELQRLPGYKPGDEHEYTLINGYRIPYSNLYRKTLGLEVEGLSSGEFFAVVSSSLQGHSIPFEHEREGKPYVVLHKVLESKFGTDTTTEIINYIKKKKTTLDELPIKQWTAKGGLVITVESGKGTLNVLLMVRKSGKKY